MRFVPFLLVAALVALHLGCAGTTPAVSASPVASADCVGVVADADISDVFRAADNAQPLYAEQFRARAIQTRHVAGASFDVPAPRGASGAYIERALSCHARGAVAVLEHPNDPLRVAGVDDVDVQEVGTRMRISVTSRERAAGEAILERARALAGGGFVEVEQLAVSSARQPL